MYPVAFYGIYHTASRKKGRSLVVQMGLGKTVQVIALVAHLLETAGDAPTKPVLIAAPASVLPNWEKEFATWAPEIKVVSYRGSAQAREEIYQRSMRLGRGSKKQAARPYNVVLTTFEFLMGKVDRPRLASIPWNYLIVDEGHR